MGEATDSVLVAVRFRLCLCSHNDARTHSMLGKRCSQDDVILSTLLDQIQEKTGNHCEWKSPCYESVRQVDEK